MKKMTTPRPARVSRRTKMLAAVLAVTGVCAGLGTAPATAMWTDAATVTATASTPSIAITQSGQSTFNTTVLPSTGAHRDTLTVTNTGALAGTATLHGSSASAAAAGMRVAVWKTSSASTCASENRPSGSVQGTWENFPEVPGVPLAAGAAQRYCVLTEVGDPELVASQGGTQDVVATVEARLASGSWVVSSPSSATMRLQYFYPIADVGLVANQNNYFVIRPLSNSGQCLDVVGSGAVDGTRVQSWTCGSNANQRFELEPTQNGNMQFRPRHAPNHPIGQSSHATVLRPVTDRSVHWRVVRVTDATYQIVHSVTGRCLTLTNQSQGQFTVCNGATNQRFTLTREPLTCSVSGTTLHLNFKSTSTTRAYTLQNRLAGGAWSNVYTQNSLTATTYGIPRSSFGGDGTLELRVVDSIGNVLYSGMTATTTASTIACGNGFA